MQIDLVNWDIASTTEERGGSMKVENLLIRFVAKNLAKGTSGLLAPAVVKGLF